MKKTLLVVLMAFILLPVFAQTDDEIQEMIDRMTPDERLEYYRIQSELFQQRLEQIYRPSPRRAIKSALDVLEGIGQLPQGTEFVRQYNRRNIFNYKDNSIDDARLEIVYFRNFSGVGGMVQITYTGKNAMTMAWMHIELNNILFDEYGAYNVSYSTTTLSEDADVSGRISPINSNNSYRFSLVRREHSGYVRLIIESIGF